MNNNRGKFIPEKISRKKEDKRKERNEFLNWILSLIIAVVIALSLRFFIFDFVVVEGDSMNPTLTSGEIMFVEKLSYKINIPEKGDIIVTRFDEEKKNYVKRVIANSGDKVEIKSGMVFVNDFKVTEPYLKEIMIGNMQEIIIPDDHIFVMGDNRNNSKDSRIVGALDLDIVRGKAVFRVLPFGKFGKLN